MQTDPSGRQDRYFTQEFIIKGEAATRSPMPEKVIITFDISIGFDRYVSELETLEISPEEYGKLLHRFMLGKKN